MIVKITCISRQGSHKVRISIDGQKVGKFDQFEYSVSIISADGYCETEIRHMTALGKQVFMNKKKVKLFTGNVSIESKKRIVKCVVERGVVHIRNTVNDSNRQRLEAMEMWIWRKMEYSSWMNKISNEEVLHRVNETKTLCSFFKTYQNLTGRV